MARPGGVAEQRRVGQAKWRRDKRRPTWPLISSCHVDQTGTASLVIGRGFSRFLPATEWEVGRAIFAFAFATAPSLTPQAARRDICLDGPRTAVAQAVRGLRPSTPGRPGRKQVRMVDLDFSHTSPKRPSRADACEGGWLSLLVAVLQASINGSLNPLPSPRGSSPKFECETTSPQTPARVLTTILDPFRGARSAVPSRVGRGTVVVA
ncbi:uncharacterized protein BDR25DRAFT_368899 [Lindgomyces ingoldianus]|uniref:Uncharacterized protein n=1 Tax=Lindgomyces ingoldianus TaxID=673940 RepID=A0ACB6QYF2_9PLEO|nr:uncharacterized protein BDR25DRAFT_368899 [Lindgomyces ingoldianus]KAF2471110.1 hypothetical protein BDR25DRAFT_368899 [Lindgomyces ingoldianus]